MPPSLKVYGVISPLSLHITLNVKKNPHISYILLSLLVSSVFASIRPSLSYFHTQVTLQLLTCGQVGRVVLQMLQVAGQMRQVEAQKVSEHRHIHTEAAQVVGEVGFRQDTLDEVDHDLQAVE